MFIEVDCIFGIVDDDMVVVKMWDEVVVFK